MNREEIERCDCMQVHHEIVDRVHQDMPDDEILYDVADLFKVFGDCTRIKILYALFESEMCVCDIADLLGTSQSAVSHQLAILRRNKLIKSRREGKSVFYSLADNHVRTIISQGLNHLEE